MWRFRCAHHSCPRDFCPRGPFQAILRDSGLGAADLAGLAHGTTVATNALLAYGVMNARKTRILAAKAMGTKWLRVLTDVTLLESLPQTFVGLRNGVSLALVIVVIAEMFIGSTDGLGQRVFEAQQLFAMPDMYAAIFAAGALGYSLNLLFLLIERRFVHWAGQ